MENRELLLEVLRAPDDDAPRERYAAWCRDQQDPPTRARADFIRAQLRLAAGELDYREQYDLGFRSSQMQKRFGAEWAAMIDKLVDDYGFDRGFVEIVTLPAADFGKTATALLQRAPIRHLNLTHIHEAQDIFKSPYLRPVRSLGLDANQLGDDDVAALAASPYLTSLRWLSLADNRISIDGALALALSPLAKQLRYVAFHGNPFQPNERYSYDNGYVVDAWLPEEGIDLEARSGRALPWLRHAARSIDDSVPDRFRQLQSSASR